MSNEVLEFIRIFTYLFGVVGLLYLGIIISSARLALFVLAIQWVIRGTLLVIGVTNQEIYRELSNIITTPSVFVGVLLIYYNLWLVRRT